VPDRLPGEFDGVRCGGRPKGGCDIQSKDPKGAISATELRRQRRNLEKCADALNAILNLKFHVERLCGVQGTRAPRNQGERVGVLHHPTGLANARSHRL